jgi:hypothetical protein
VGVDVLAGAGFRHGHKSPGRMIWQNGFSRMVPQEKARGKKGFDVKQLFPIRTVLVASSCQA